MSSSEKGPSQASLLVALAKAGYDLVMSEDGRPYGIRRNGPNLALPLRGRAGLRSQLARRFTDANDGQVPSQSALADAMTVLEGIAAAHDPAPVHLRVAGDAERIVLDLGTADGRCVVVTPDGWQVQARSPVLFRRSGAMSPLPAPEAGGDGIALLRGLLNMDDDAFHQLIAWLIAAWIPHIPHPVLTVKGEQGTGKSKAAQMIINLVDPSPATKRSQPRDVKTWATQAFNSWAMCLDNVSVIPPWFSDTLCRAVTGDGILDRALYTDDDVVVLVFRRVLAMTTIDAGALAGDLAERVLLLDLQLIEEEQRRTEEELDAVYAAARPAIIASLLDLLASVLRELPSVRLTRMPRMADFTRVLAAVDQVTGWTTQADYLAASENVSADALDGDPFGSAVVGFISTHGSWAGTATQLLDLVPPPDGYHPKWPKDATRAGGQLKRLAPLLRAVGITFDDTERQPDGNRSRLYRLTATEMRCNTAPGEPTAPATPSEQGKLPGADADTSTRNDGDSTRSGVLPGAAPGAGQLTAPGSQMPSDQHGYPPPGAVGAPGAALQAISGYALRCATCQQPMNPALTTAGHLTHPDRCPTDVRQATQSHGGEIV